MADEPREESVNTQPREVLPFRRPPPERPLVRAVARGLSLTLVIDWKRVWEALRHDR